MSVYESATNLANDIKESKEYNNFKDAMQELKQDKDNEDLLKNYKFIKAQMESCKNVDRNLYLRSKGLYESIQRKAMKNKKVYKYIEAEQKFTTMMNNINNILAEAVENDYK